MHVHDCHGTPISKFMSFYSAGIIDKSFYCHYLFSETCEIHDVTCHPGYSTLPDDEHLVTHKILGT